MKVERLVLGIGLCARDVEWFHGEISYLEDGIFGHCWESVQGSQGMEEVKSGVKAWNWVGLWEIENV